MTDFSVDKTENPADNTSMNIQTLIRIPGISSRALVPYASKGRSQVVACSVENPPPFWLLQALRSWYLNNNPIEPVSFDEAFLTEFEPVWQSVVGVPSGLRELVTKCKKCDTAHPAGPCPNNPNSRKGKKNANDLNRTVTESQNGDACHERERGSNRTEFNGAKCDVLQFSSKTHANETGNGASDSSRTPEVLRSDADRKPRIGVLGEKDASDQLVPLFTPEQINNPVAGAFYWKRIQGPGKQAMRREFKAACCERGFNQGKSPEAFNRAMIRHVGKCARPARTVSVVINERKHQLADYLLSIVAPVETTGIKGFGLHFENHTWQDQLATIRGALRAEKVQATIQQIYGSVPCEKFVDKLFRERHGVANKLDIASDKLRSELHRTTGIQANWAGEFFYMDATRLPIFVNGAWGKMRKDASMSHWLHAITDDRSLFSLLYCHALPSETAGWDYAMVSFFERLGYAPPFIYTDNASKLAHDLYQQKYGADCTLGDGLRLAVALGVHVSSHQKNNPSAKGRIEAGAMKAGKSELKSCMIASACQQGINLKNYRNIEGQAAWTAMQAEWHDRLNARRLRGQKFSRKDAFDQHAESAAHRDRTRFNSEAWADWRSYASNVQLGQVIGNTIRVKLPGVETKTAELVDPTGKCPVNHMDGSTVIIARSGLVTGDDPDMQRVVIVDALDKTRISKHYSVHAKVKAMTFWGDLEKAKIGSHPVTKIDTFESRQKKAWYNAANPTSALREATTGEPVEGPSFNANE